MADEIKTSVTVEVDSSQVAKAREESEALAKNLERAAKAWQSIGTKGVRASTTGAGGPTPEQNLEQLVSGGGAAGDPGNIPGRKAATGGSGGSGGGGTGGGRRSGGGTDLGPIGNLMFKGPGITVGQMRGGAAASVAMLTNMLLQTSLQWAAKDIALQADTSAGQQHRRQANLTRSLVGGGAKAGIFLGSAGLAMALAPVTGGASLALGGLAGTVGLGLFGGAADAAAEYAAADDELKGSAVTAVQQRVQAGQGLMRRMGRARFSSQDALGAGLGTGRNISGLRNMNDMGFTGDEAARFAEMASIGGLGQAGFRGSITTHSFDRGDELAQMQRAGFDPRAGVRHVGMFRRGGGADYIGDSRSAFGGHLAASQFGLRGAGADEFANRMSSFVTGSFQDRGLVTMYNQLESQLRAFAENDVLVERGSRNIGLFANMRESGMGLRDELVGGIGGAMDKMAQFRTLAQGMRGGGGLVGGLQALEETAADPKARRAQLASVPGRLGVIARMHAARATAEEAKAIGDAPMDPSGAALPGSLTPADIRNAGANEYKTGVDFRKGEFSRLEKALDDHSGVLDKVFKALNSVNDNLERIGRAGALELGH